MADVDSIFQGKPTDPDILTVVMKNGKRLYCDEVCPIDSTQEEPVSEDLDEAGKEWLRPQLDKSYANYGEAKMMELTHFDGYSMLEAIEFGAKWKKEQMMKNAVLETEVLRDSDGDGVDTPYESWLTLANTEIPELPENLGLKEGDKVKILIVKSE